MAAFHPCDDLLSISPTDRTPEVHATRLERLGKNGYGSARTRRRRTLALFPKHLVPYFPSLPVEDVRSGFFERADVDALLQHVEDKGIRDFIAWTFGAGLRKGEIARLTWDMLDRTGTPLGPQDPRSDHEERTGRTLGREGDVKAIIERRVRLRRFNSPLIFHRVCKGNPGQPITDFWELWKAALHKAGLPAGRLFHDLRRSARSGRLSARAWMRRRR